MTGEGAPTDWLLHYCQWVLYEAFGEKKVPNAEVVVMAENGSVVTIGVKNGNKSGEYKVVRPSPIRVEGLAPRLAD